MASLTTPHERALTLLLAELERGAAEHGEVFVGTPGTVAERSNAQRTRFWVHRYSDAAGKRREEYLIKLDAPDAARRVDALRERIEAANSMIASVRLLARAGFATVDRKTYFTLATLHNHGLFKAGAFLIGSHAYGALLNALGVRAVPYATADVGIARAGTLAVAAAIPSLFEMLRATGIEFLEVPSLRRRQPSTSFAERGRSRLRVDLLVPSRGKDYPIVAVPELKAHAKGLPYLGYLLGASQQVPVLSAQGVVMVRTPAPERFAIHKLIASQLRNKTSSKPEKDVVQAATLIEALAERFPGAVEDALAAAPRSAKRYLARAVKALKMHLPASAETAWEPLASITR